jgi:hypothetical protein
VRWTFPWPDITNWKFGAWPGWWLRVKVTAAGADDLRPRWLHCGANVNNCAENVADTRPWFGLPGEP